MNPRFTIQIYEQGPSLRFLAYGIDAFDFPMDKADTSLGPPLWMALLTSLFFLDCKYMCQRASSVGLDFYLGWYLCGMEYPRTIIINQTFPCNCPSWVRSFLFLMPEEAGEMVLI